jgi:hypothetical protein
MPPRRPFGVTLLAWAVLILSAWGVIRCIAALRWWAELIEFDARPGPLYLAVTGAGWGVAGGVLFRSLASRKLWSRIAAPASVIAWQIQLWIERFVSPSSSPNLPFAISLSILITGMIIVAALHRSTRYYLHKSEEHEQPDQHPKTT